MKKPRVLYVSGDVRTGGGGRGVSTLILEALAREFDLTHLCTVPPDLPAVDAWFGSNLSGLTWKTVRPSSFERWLVRRIPGEGAFHEVNYLLRCAKRIAPEFDVTFACCDMEADVGAPGIQYLHYPYFGDRPWRRWLPGDAAPLRLAGALLAGRTDPWMAISGYDVERSRRNLTLTNSHWTARRISALLDIESTVVYPPALGRFPEAAWETRADGFVSIGQLERGKRFDWIIDTMARVHRQWPAVQLHLCCHQDPRWERRSSISSNAKSVRRTGGYICTGTFHGWLWENYSVATGMGFTPNSRSISAWLRQRSRVRVPCPSFTTVADRWRSWATILDCASIPPTTRPRRSWK